MISNLPLLFQPQNLDQRSWAASCGGVVCRDCFLGGVSHVCGDSVPYLKVELQLLLVLEFFRLKTVVFMLCSPSFLVARYLVVPVSIRHSHLLKSWVVEPSFIDISSVSMDSMCVQGWGGGGIPHSVYSWINSIEVHQIVPLASTKPEFHCLCPDRQRHSLE